MKFIDFFAGIGGFRRGMELAGHECVGFCEFDKFATASYTSMHLLTQEQREFLDKMPLKQRQKEILKEEYRNGEWYANDIRKVYAGDIPKADCWCFGFPCFVRGTYILTEKGYIPIENVSVGDRVLTHKGRWKTVTSVMQRDNARIWNVNGFGILPTGTTAEHPYYVTRVSEPIEFKPVKELNDTPQWCCLMKNQTNTAKRSGGLSDAILLMGGEFADKIDHEGEGLCLRSVIKNEKNLSTDCQKRTCMELTLKKGLAGSIMCAITNYTNTLVYSRNMHMENEYQEKHCVCHEKRPNTFITDTCQEMAETTKKKQHQPVQQSFLVCALLHSDWKNLCQLSIILKEIQSALLKEGNASKETPTLLESLTNRLKDIIVEDMFAENCISQQNLINTKQYITLALKKMNLTLQTGQSSTTVKTSPLQENSLDFKETVQACFSELCTSLDNSKKKIDPLTFSLRTLRICLALMEDGISPDCLLKWTGGVRCGMASAQL